jgi:hypothetical protein
MGEEGCNMAGVNSRFEEGANRLYVLLGSGELLWRGRDGKLVCVRGDRGDIEKSDEGAEAERNEKGSDVGEEERKD